MQFFIRPLEEKDKKSIENICLATANNALNKNETTREFTLQMYSRYYSRAEQKHCFVATCADDKVIGYILCAPDFKRYWQSFQKTEAKAIFKSNGLKGLYAISSAAIQFPFYKAYPAHLHVDILPQYQHCGIGKALMDALKAHLKTIGCKGVMLVVGDDNLGAIAFYKKQGFVKIKHLFGGEIMGLSLK